MAGQPAGGWVTMCWKHLSSSPAFGELAWDPPASRLEAEEKTFTEREIADDEGPAAR